MRIVGYGLGLRLGVTITVCVCLADWLYGSCCTGCPVDSEQLGE